MKALETLSAQVSLALESAALASDLLERQSSERFRALMQNSSDVIIVLEPDGSIRYNTPSIESVLGYDARPARRGSRSSRSFTRMIVRRCSVCSPACEIKRGAEGGTSSVPSVATEAPASSRLYSTTCSRTTTSTASCSPPVISASTNSWKNSSPTKPSTTS